MLFDRFELVRVISLPERHDRRREMTRQLRSVGLEIGDRVRFFDACRPVDARPFISKGAHGCYRSHLEVLKEADGRSVLILEDDCDFTPHAQYYDPVDFDMFYGGFLQVTRPDDPASGGVVGSHCMGFAGPAARVAADYLEGLLDPSFPPDPVAATEAGFDPAVRPPIDGAYIWFRRAHPALRTHFAPFLTTQRASRSDITPGRLDRIPFVADLVETMRVVRRQMQAKGAAMPA